MSICGQKRKREHKHPYLSGNFAPIRETRPLTPCHYSGAIPKELHGGQYVRNGGNPVSDEDLGCDAHWFDGDGMLTGVAFRRPDKKSDDIQPEFVNQYILTDLCLSKSTSSVMSPIMPSIATLVNPLSSLLRIGLCVLRTIFLVILSHLPGSQRAIKRISVANTAILYHDGRALATCESGPPIRVRLPALETVGWYDGVNAEGEPVEEKKGAVFGGEGLLSFMKEWTTGHPKVDPVTNEMILYHNTFEAPYVHYSVIPATGDASMKASRPSRRLVNIPVYGVSGAKMMHDFGVSRTRTLIMDLPLTLDPFNLLKNRPVVAYDPSQPSRFGIFSRHDPSNVRWFSTSACCIFHTANMWDTSSDDGTIPALNLLTCRMTSATLVFSAGNITPPQTVHKTDEEPSRRPVSFFDKYDEDFEASEPTEANPLRKVCRFEDAPNLESRKLPTPLEDHELLDEEEDQCRLYYYSFDLSSPSSNNITHQWALSTVSFEFPSVRPDREMDSARYIYGCSTSSSSFGAALGRAVKIDVLAKIDAHTLIERGRRNPPTPVTGCVDTRPVEEILASQRQRQAESTENRDPIQLFQLPPKHFAQEPRFVPCANSATEDDGFLLFYVFDESQLLPSGECSSAAVSELWIIDARNMRDVVAKVRLPQRVPYGLHGNWFSEEAIRNQRAAEKVRSLEESLRSREVMLREGSTLSRSWMGIRGWLERMAG